MYDGYICSVDVLCSVDVVYDDWAFSHFIFPRASFSVCVDVDIMSCWSNITFSDTLISRWRKYALLLSAVFIKV